jgi:hypothetical protein
MPFRRGGVPQIPFDPKDRIAKFQTLANRTRASAQGGLPAVKAGGAADRLP